MALGDRINRAEDNLGPELCAERPCATINHTELLLLPGGRTERVGNAPPPLCVNCPEREAAAGRIRHVEIVLDYRGRHTQQEATSPARIAPALQHVAALSTEPEQALLPGKQQAEEADPVMRQARQMQQQEDQEAARHEGRRRSTRQGPLFGPEDFGA